MDFILSKVSDPYFCENIRFSSLEEFMNFIREINNEVIVGTNANGTPVLLIYDDCFE